MRVVRNGIVEEIDEVVEDIANTSGDYSYVKIPEVPIKWGDAEVYKRYKIGADGVPKLVSKEEFRHIITGEGKEDITETIANFSGDFSFLRLGKYNIILRWQDDTKTLDRYIINDSGDPVLVSGAEFKRICGIKKANKSPLPPVKAPEIPEKSPEIPKQPKQ